MKKLFFTFIILPLLVLSITSCNNDDDAPTNPIDQLPPATQTGENTFGCLVNGEPFVVTNSSLMVAIYQQGQLQFGGGGIFIIINEPFITNNQIDLSGKARYIENINQESCYYDFDNSFQGYVNFSIIDQINYIISGTFEFSTVNDECEVVHITDGRFDLHYIP